ncbi:ROK family protein [Clostridium grantii]|uniref:fructokinase n=1 Tax=Clostridium grantii DSM 8605 TaxID=1121316 RepID=A0A1M5RQ63_9CLOT|nr:ROK family protein [Clostridium grantii]SHH28412.1 fructokinase [Clostridium grantii DSM 8605]
MLFAAIEAGGTKFVCAIGNEKGEVLEKESYPTTTPEETMAKVIEFFKDKEFVAMGVGSFGPIDPDKKSQTYGSITSTPKVGWSNYNIIKELNKHFNVPKAFDTDVNGAALGELTWGTAKGLQSCLYITVGTGIGAGAVVENNLVHGLLHPEMGHIFVRRHKEDTYEGKCPFHKDCLEGLAAGPAIEARWGVKGHEIPSDHQGWDFEAYYLAQALVNYILILSPQKIIMGGGVMQQKHIFPKIREYVVELLNGYVQKNEILKNIDEYIVYPELGQSAGTCGAIALAMKALQ